MEILALIVLSILCLRTLVAAINFITGQWLPSGEPEKYPFVSVIIPARNEERNIGNILDDLSKQNYPSFEVIVYDDASTDKTAETASGFSSLFKCFNLIQAESAPPDGWFGKNYACYVPAQKAKGDYLLFIDADVSVSPWFLKDMVTFSQKHKLHLLSIFPVQIMKTEGEKLLVPLMNRVLLSLLPLILTRISRRVSLSAANGQVMFFNAETYKKYQFHSLVRSEIVDDIAIFRALKRLRLKSQTLLSNGQVSCRMYNSFATALNGFSKNVFSFFGGSVMMAVLYAATSALGWIPVVLSGNMLFLLIWLIMTLTLILATSALSRQSFLSNLLYSIPQQISFLILIAVAFRYKIKGGYQWKSRNIK